METLTIGNLANKAHVNVETVRYYERMELISKPLRPQSGYRQYSQDSVTRIIFIKRAQELGFSLKEISELLTLRVDPETTCDDFKNRALIKIAGIEERIDNLQKMKRALKKLTASCDERCPTCECPILEALEANEEYL